MKIHNLTTDAAILQELGARLAWIRKQHNFSQDDLAREAGLGVATVRRIEAGEGSQMESWIKILKALKLSSLIDALLPENFESPMTQALADKKSIRKRAPKSVQWGDEEK